MTLSAHWLAMHPEVALDAEELEAVVAARRGSQESHYYPRLDWAVDAIREDRYERFLDEHRKALSEIRKLERLRKEVGSAESWRDKYYELQQTKQKDWQLQLREAYERGVSDAVANVPGARDPRGPLEVEVVEVTDGYNRRLILKEKDRVV